jgi:hypothetical protein
MLPPLVRLSGQEPNKRLKTTTNDGIEMARTRFRMFLTGTPFDSTKDPFNQASSLNFELTKSYFDSVAAAVWRETINLLQLTENDGYITYDDDADADADAADDETSVRIQKSVADSVKSASFKEEQTDVLYKLLNGPLSWESVIILSSFCKYKEAFVAQGPEELEMSFVPLSIMGHLVLTTLYYYYYYGLSKPVRNAWEATGKLRVPMPFPICGNCDVVQDAQQIEDKGCGADKCGYANYDNPKAQHQRFVFPGDVTAPSPLEDHEPLMKEEMPYYLVHMA